MRLSDFLVTHKEKVYDLRQKIVELANQISLLQQKELLLVTTL